MMVTATAAATQHHHRQQQHLTVDDDDHLFASAALEYADDMQQSSYSSTPKPTRTFGVDYNSSAATASPSSTSVTPQAGDVSFCRNKFSRHQHNFFYLNDAFVAHDDGDCEEDARVEEEESRDKLGTVVGVERRHRDSLSARANVENGACAVPSVSWSLAVADRARRYSTPALAFAQKKLSFAGSGEVVTETLTTREMRERRKTIMFPSAPTTDDDKWIHRIYSQLGGVSPHTMIERKQFLNIVDKNDLLYQHVFNYYDRMYRNDNCSSTGRKASIKVFDLFSELRRVAQMNTLDKIRLLFDVFSAESNGMLAPHDFKQLIKCLAKDRKISLSDEQLGAVVDTIFEVAKTRQLSMPEKISCINAVTWADNGASDRRLSHYEFHDWLVNSDAGGEKRLIKATTNFLRPPSCDGLQHLISPSLKPPTTNLKAARRSPLIQPPKSACAHGGGGGSSRSNCSTVCTRCRSLCNSILPRVFQPRYVRNHPSRAIWSLMGILLFIACFLYGQLNALFSTDPIERKVTTLQCQRVYSGAKGFGFNLNVWCAVMILLMCRRTLSAIRNSPTLRHLVPVDSAVYAHKMIAWWVLTPCVIGHVGFHLAHFACISHLPDTHATYAELLFTAKAHLGWLGSRVLLGWLLILCQLVIFVGALPVIRRSGLFEVFFWSHLLFVVYLIGLILHSDKFIFFIAIPAIIYATEKLYGSQFWSNKTHGGQWFLREAVLWPSGVTGLVLNRPISFQYRPGDYIYIKIPAVARNEWHPFTISSAPENKDYMTLHIRSLGGWTRRLHEYLRTQYSDQIISNTLPPAGTTGELVSNLFDNSSNKISDQILATLAANSLAVSEIEAATANNIEAEQQVITVTQHDEYPIASAVSVVPHAVTPTSTFYTNKPSGVETCEQKLSNSTRRSARYLKSSKSADLSIHLREFHHRFGDMNDDLAVGSRKGSAFSDYNNNIPTVVRIQPSPHGIRRSSSPTYLPSTAKPALQHQQQHTQANLIQRLRHQFNLPSSSSISTITSGTAATGAGSPVSSGYSTAARTSRTNSIISRSSEHGTSISTTPAAVCEAPDGRSCTLKPPPPATPSKQRRDWPRSISILGQRVMAHANNNSSSKLSTASCLSTQASLALSAAAAASSAAMGVVNESYDVEAGVEPLGVGSSDADQQSTNLPDDENLMRVYVDGPYGAPASTIFHAEHAVLICAGIGITPSASILESLLLRYKSCKVCCDSCERCWVSDGMLDDKLGRLKKVEFIWVVRSQAEVEWFHDRLNQLEREQDAIERLRHFIQIHLYVTSAKKNDSDLPSYIIDAALDATYEHQRVDLITGLGYRAKPGRPNWEELFTSIEQNREGKVDVFYCGARTLGKELAQLCEKHHFGFSKENF